MVHVFNFGSGHTRNESVGDLCTWTQTRPSFPPVPVGSDHFSRVLKEAPAIVRQGRCKEINQIVEGRGETRSQENGSTRVSYKLYFSHSYQTFDFYDTDVVNVLSRRVTVKRVSSSAHAWLSDTILWRIKRHKTGGQTGMGTTQGSLTLTHPLTNRRRKNIEWSKINRYFRKSTKFISPSLL